MKKGAKTDMAVVYQAKTGAIALRGDFTHETVWASLDQIAALFGRDKSVISRHLKNIFKEGELERKSVVAKNATTAADGKIYQVEYFNLDVILSVGYRVNGKIATMFRQWATKTLREHITKGYTIDRRRVVTNYDAFMKSVADIKALLPEHVVFDPKDVIELIREFANTWVSLDAYDRDALTVRAVTKKSVKLTGEELRDAIAALKQELVRGNEATDLFAMERSAGTVEGIVGNVMQSFSGKSVYASIEEKAAHLLYFMVKNHPFVDGNKRSGAFAFVWFLRRSGVKGSANINPASLIALTLLIAESDPKKKDRMVALITRML